MNLFKITNLSIQLFCCSCCLLFISYFTFQEIDGRSLLLMKRADVINGLKLKLGPALKIYRQVVKLQLRRDDPKLYWL